VGAFGAGEHAGGEALGRLSPGQGADESADGAKGFEFALKVGIVSHGLLDSAGLLVAQFAVQPGGKLFQDVISIAHASS